MLNKKTISLIALVVSATLIFLMMEENESVNIEPNALTQHSEDKSQLKKNLAINTLSKGAQPTARASSQSPTTPKADASPLSYIDSIKANTEKNSFHEALLKDHQNQSKYPDYNQRIANIEQDPVERRYEIDERTTQNEEGDKQLTIWTDKKYYLHGDEVTVFAILEDARGVRLTTDFFGQLIYNETQDLQHFKFYDSDQDGIYEFRLTLEQDSKPALLAGIYKILIINTTDKMIDAASFTLSQPEIQLTGEYRDIVSSKGDLLIQAEVEVTSRNRFYFQAALYSSTNDPIGSTQISGELSSGRHWISLEFDGLMIRDAAEPGPYLLKSISLAKVAFPIQRAPLIYPEFYTQGYSVEQFRATNYAEEEGT